MSPETLWQLQGEKKINTPQEKKERKKEKSFTLIGKNQQALERGEGAGEGLVALLETSVVLYLLSLLYNDELHR